eukprot:TRINITY_DN39565_c0_g1_i2.p1 TRINITY_DN39565_c0_g1~~TRINITY_DN39565_c0_g1_i2.p1  ORF type:complete len:374 (+),score=57.86 TRINITY_DN39565_c0_g1_i2:39-1124(+)
MVSPKVGGSLDENGRRSVRSFVRKLARVLCTPRILSVVGFLCFGPSLILVNKHIMEADLFPYPLTIAAIGLSTSALASHVLVRLGFATVRPEALAATSGRNWYKTGLSIGFCNAMMHATGNAVYLFLGVGFIQMLKAFSPAVIMAVAYLAGLQIPSQGELGCVVLIITGTLFEVRGETHATITGLSLMFMSELFEAVNLVLSQRMFTSSKLTVVEALYIVSPVSAGCLALLITVHELPRMASTLDGASFLAVLPDLCIAATLGLLVNFFGFTVLQATSAVTFKVLNIMRGLGVIIVGIVFYGEDCSLLEALGYGVSICGFCGYSYFQVYPDHSPSWRSMGRIAKAAGCCGRRRRPGPTLQP